MAEKQWKDLSVTEKLDELRADIVKTMNVVNHLSARLQNLTGGAPLRQELADIKRRLDILERKA
jgi:hypothetical protein